ncbi:MAG: DUF4367 domain-containing protein [Clostridia bacterium]|nr:DUF4367 domain-containing protein [Clostridia bacterium]
MKCHRNIFPEQKNDKENSILWHDNNYAYSTHGNISQKEMLKNVENIEIIKIFCPKILLFSLYKRRSL